MNSPLVDMQYLKLVRQKEIEIYKERGVEILNIVLPPEKEVNDLPLTTRLKNVLIKNNIKTVKDIDNLSTIDLLQIKGLGNQFSTQLGTFMFQYQLGQFYDYFKFLTYNMERLDKNGRLLFDGDQVLVPEPNSDDMHNHEFVGTVDGFTQDDWCQVVDQEGNFFCFDASRLEYFDENIQLTPDEIRRLKELVPPPKKKYRIMWEMEFEYTNPLEAAEGCRNDIIRGEALQFTVEEIPKYGERGSKKYSVDLNEEEGDEVVEITE